VFNGWRFETIRQLGSLSLHFLSKGHLLKMHVKKYSNEIVLGLAVGFMIFYPPHIGVILFGLALLSLIGLRVVEALHTRDDHKTQAQIDKIKADVERLVLQRRGGGSL
jgi:hypothetical protein